MIQKMTDAQKALVEKHLWLAHWAIRKRGFNRNLYEYEDLYQIGALGLCVAAMNFKPERGNSFSTYGAHYAFGYICRYMNKRGKSYEAEGLERLEDVVQQAEGITLCDQMPDVEDGESMARYVALRDMIDRLPEQTREIIRMRAGGAKQTEIAKRLDVSQPTVHRHMLRAQELFARDG